MVKCAFCRSVIEDRDHLFFECGVAKRIWTLVMQNCGVLNPPIRWEDVISVGLDHWKKKTLQANICRLGFGCTIYNLWRNINEIKHAGHPRT
jgi:hypothetical protein